MGMSLNTNSLMMLNLEKRLKRNSNDKQEVKTSENNTNQASETIKENDIKKLMVGMVN